MKHVSSFIFTFSLLVLGCSAYAQDGSRLIHSSTVIGPACLISAPQDIEFGDYNPSTTHFSNHNDKTTTVSLRCTKGSFQGGNVHISMGPGLNQTGGGCINRNMRSDDGDLLSYKLYTDPTRTLSWGCMDKGEGGYDASSLDNGLINNLTVYARIPAAQNNARAGEYLDEISVYVNF